MEHNKCAECDVGREPSPSATTPRSERRAVRLTPAIDLPAWKLAANVAVCSAPRFGQSLDRSGVVLRVNALI